MCGASALTTLLPEILGFEYEGDSGRIVFRRQISGSDLTRLRDDMTAVSRYDAQLMIFEICEQNLAALDAFMQRTKSDYRSNPRNFRVKYSRALAVEAHRLTMNYLTAVRTFDDHWREISESHKSESVAVFHASFSYRFAMKYRNYVQHVGPPPLDVRFVHKYVGPRGASHRSVFICLSRDYLLETYRSWGDAREGLQREPASIDFMFHIRALHSKITGLASNRVAETVEGIRPAVERLRAQINHVRASHPDATPCVRSSGSIQQAPDGDAVIPVMRLPVTEVENIERFLAR